MQTSKPSHSLQILKLMGFILTLLCFALLLLSFRAKKLYSDIWQELGISKEQGSNNIRESFMSGYLHYYGTKAARQLLTGDRAALAKDLMQFARQQVASENFRRDYEKRR